jgi:predicted lipoprotein with Yx(FWY)xxD motif
VFDPGGLRELSTRAIPHAADLLGKKPRRRGVSTGEGNRSFDQKGRPMKRILIFIAALVAVAVVVAVVRVATSSSTPATESGKASAATLQTRKFPGAGTVLVNATGQPLYAADQEAGGAMRCTGACTAIWKPLAAKGTPTATVAGSLGTVTRSDGTMQVTYNGKLLYTFSFDQPGKVAGDNFHDAFGGQKFTWHVVRQVGAATPAPMSGSGNSGSSGGFRY